MGGVYAMQVGVYIYNGLVNVGAWGSHLHQRYGCGQIMRGTVLGVALAPAQSEGQREARSRRSVVLLL